jgi:hypothetical protein
MVIGALLEPYDFTGAPSGAAPFADVAVWACVVAAVAGFAGVGGVAALCAQANVATPAPNKRNASRARAAPTDLAQHERRVAPSELFGM